MENVCSFPFLGETQCVSVTLQAHKLLVGLSFEKTARIWWTILFQVVLAKKGNSNERRTISRLKYFSRQMNLTGYDSYIAMLHDNYHNDSSNKTFVIGGQYLSLKFWGGLSMLVWIESVCIPCLLITDYLLLMVKSATVCSRFLQ